jgi:serine/threonine protein kinase
MTLFSKKKGVEVGLDDFKIRKVLGKGSFGKVFLVEKIDDNTPYAMKALRTDLKYYIRKRDFTQGSASLPCGNGLRILD